MNDFLRGIASIFDLSGSLYRQQTAEILARSDADALKADREAVAGDMRRAFETVREEVEGTRNPRRCPRNP